MSSVHYKISITSRAEGKMSAVGGAAYRSAEKIYNHRDGETHDFSRKRGVAYKEIILPEHTPRDFEDRAILWNSVEHAERQKNAQLFRDVLIGLPAEINREGQIDLVRGYVQKQFVDRGMCADICVHDKGDGNPHAHIMLTMRPLNQDGTWGAKSHKEYVLDSNGERIMLPSGNWKSKKITTTDWDSPENAEKWRQAWEHEVNREYERRGLEVRIDMRSFERQGLDIEPTKRMSREEIALENKGIPTTTGDHNRGVKERNAQRERGRHVRNLEEKHFSQREQREEQSRERGKPYEVWLEAHKKEQSRGLERGR